LRFRKDGEESIASPSTVVRLFTLEWDRVAVAPLLTARCDIKDYFTVIVEQGAPDEHRMHRLRYRLGL
jgi:hypothetical protein